MRENKNSFIVYTEWTEQIKMLDEQGKAELLDAMLDFHSEESADEFHFSNGMTKIVFSFMKQAFVRDNEKWNTTKEKRSEAGKKHKGNQYSQQTEQMEQTEKKDSDFISNGTNGTSVPTLEQNGTNGTVNVNDNVNVNVNDNVSVNVNVQESQISLQRESEIPAKTDTDNLYTKISKWFSDKELEVSESSRVQLYYRLSNIKYDLGFLDYCWNYILGQYPKKTKNEVTSLFVKAALTFQNLVNNYATLLSTKKSEAEAEERKEASAEIRKSAPKTCSCGDFFCLPENEGGILTVRCPCGNYSQYSPTERRWIFTDKKQVESFDLMNFRVGQKVGVST